MSRMQWVVWLGMSFGFILLALLGSAMLQRLGNGTQPETGAREPLPGLNYCSTEGRRPCVLTFHVDARGRMVVNLLTDPSLPGFDLQINHTDGSSRYSCVKAGGVSTSISCSGDVMPAGEVLQFLLLSRRDNSPLAEGQFAIIGMALATPDLATTPTRLPAWERPPR